jgi:thiosulfate dehydrogenase
MKKVTRKFLAAVTVVAAGLLVWSTECLASRAAATAALVSPAAFVPPSDSDIPAGKFGDSVRLGEKIFREPDIYATAYVGNDLRCGNCHLQEGRLAGASPMWAAYVAYPAYRAKNGHVNSFEERLQGCFRYSMNGKAPPLGDPVLIALESYSYYLAKGLPTDEPARGRGFPQLPKPPLTADYARGSEVYAQKCAACHGADGHGQSAEGKPPFPPQWGPRSYNWGAGMTSIKSAAEFIRANMPLGAGGTLSVQQAWDAATYPTSTLPLRWDTIGCEILFVFDSRFD